MNTTKTPRCRNIAKMIASLIYEAFLAIIAVLAFIYICGEMTPEAEDFLTEWIGGFGCTAVLFISKIIAGFVMAGIGERLIKLDEEREKIAL